MNTINALAILKALGHGSNIRSWDANATGEGCLAVYADWYDDVWRIACDVGHILPAPKWDTIGGGGILYWPSLPYSEPPDEEEG